MCVCVCVSASMCVHVSVCMLTVYLLSRIIYETMHTLMFIA